MLILPPLKYSVPPLFVRMTSSASYFKETSIPSTYTELDTQIAPSVHSHQSMQSSVEVRFRVRAPAAPWEKMFVAGSHANLGEWIPGKALPLTRDEHQRDVWSGSVFIPSSTKEFGFRYVIGSWLDAAKDGSKPVLTVIKWEALLHPRRCLPAHEVRDGVARQGTEDVFGHYDGKVLVSDGWITNSEEHVVLLRIHGQALKFYKARYKDKEHRLKVVPFDVRFREMFCGYEDSEEADPAPRVLWRASSVYAQSRDSVEDESVPESERDAALPDVASFSNTELSVLTREDPIFGEQYVNGSVFRNNVDYLVFRTRTVAIEYLGFRIELFHGDTRVGMAYALPSALPDTYGKSSFPIISTHHSPLGQVDVDYMLVKHLPIEPEQRDSMALSYGRYWRKRKTLEVGHRGMGSSYTKSALARENTIQSLNSAAKKGADYVEFDVQLTKDFLPVIYHDFHVLVEVAGRNGKLWAASDEDHRHHQMAVKDLKLAQLNLLHLEHVGHSSSSSAEKSSSAEEIIRVVPTERERRLSRENTEDEDEHNPFPSLDKVLQKVDTRVGFNIEVKYPMYMKDGSHECENYFERNRFVDIILSTVFRFAAGRRILFSSFDPDICTLISQKQHMYPVLFLVVGATTRYTPFQDIRSDCSRMAVNCAAANSLLGVNFHSEELLADQKPLARAEKYGLVSFVWGDDLNTKENQSFFKNQLKVDGLIYDRIGEEESRQNVFVVEREARAALFSTSSHPSPVPSRRNSEERPKDTSSSPTPTSAPRSPRRGNSVYQASSSVTKF